MNFRDFGIWVVCDVQMVVQEYPSVVEANQEYPNVVEANQEYLTVMEADQEYLKAAGKVRNLTEANIFAFSLILTQFWTCYSSGTSMASRRLLRSTPSM